MKKGTHTRSELTRTRQSLAATRNRAQRFHAKAAEAEQQVRDLTLAVMKLEHAQNESRPGDYSEAASNRKDKTMN